MWSGWGYQGQVQGLFTLGMAAYVQFQRTGNAEDIDKAIEYWGDCAALLPNSHATLLGLLQILSMAYSIRFERIGNVSDLNESISYGLQAVVFTHDGHPDKPGYLTCLGIAYRTRFKRLGDISDLNEAIAFASQAISLTPDDHPNRPSSLRNLGLAYGARFQRLGDMSDLKEVIKFSSQAVLLTPDNHPDKAETFSNLGIAYMARFNRLGDISDLDKAIASIAQAISLSPDGHPDKPGRLNNLGVAYTTRFERLGDISDLNEAIAFASQAVSLTHDGHIDKPATLTNLGKAYRTRFDRLGGISDLNEAIASASQAVLLTPDDHPDKPPHLVNLGFGYINRFKGLGDVSDLNEAIALVSQAISLTPDGHPDKPGYLRSLGIAYTARFKRLGDISDLNEAISSSSQGVSLTPGDHPNKPWALGNLGDRYFARFNRLGDISDLNEAIAYASQAASLAPDGHPEKPACLSILGVTHLARFERLGDVSDVNKAIAFGSQAVLLTPDDHPGKPSYLSNLGDAYRTRFERHEDVSDLNEAVAYSSRAVSLAPDGHPDKPACLGNLGIAYWARFERLGDVSDLNKAITSGSQAVSLTPDGHPDKPGYLNNLGAAHTTRFELLSNASDLQSAISAFASAAQSPTGPPLLRFRACRVWARLLFINTSSSPHPAYHQAVELLPLLIWIGTTLKRRYELIVEVGNFFTEAASYAISTNAFDIALEWLEAGRSIVWGQKTQLRTPFDQLASHDPLLANKLRDVSSQLERAGSRASSTPAVPNADHDLVDEADTHIKLALSWEELLKEVRSIPGFEDFLCRPKSSRLMKAARRHPVAIINCHQSRCDALIIQPNNDAIAHISLLNFSHEIASTTRSNMRSLARRRGSRKPGKLQPVGDKPHDLRESLGHVWLGVVKPVLDFLGFVNPLPINQLPHITWCTTGILSFLPLHGAGCYNQIGSSIFNYVISSYTPTLSALLTCQSRSSADHCGLVAIGQEGSLGPSHLPCVRDELKVIEEHARSGIYLQLEGYEATIDGVLDAMEQFSSVHLACHGTQDIYDATQSAFHLHDGPLTLEAIASRPFANKGLAFLSACETATGDKTLPDEAIHLAAGMLMAGFPSVIGTMWSIIDEDGPKVADTVYAELLKDGKMDYTNTAKALHLAVARLRAEVGEDAVERWAPFIHIGY